MTALLVGLVSAVLSPQDGFREAAEFHFRDYMEPRKTDEEREAILDRLAACGPAVIRILRECARREPPLIRRRYPYIALELMRRLLDRAADRRGVETLDRLKAVVSLSVREASPEALLAELRRHFIENVLVDPAEQEELRAVRLTASVESVPLVEAFEQVLEPAGLDFYARGPFIVIARANRLWGSGGRVETPALGEEAAAELEEALKALHSERAEDRAAAEARILALGRGALPRLREAARSSRTNHRERAWALVLRLAAPRHPDVLHPAVAARTQVLDEDDRDLLGRATSNEISIDFRDESVDFIFKKIAEISEIPIGIDGGWSPAAGRGRLTFAARRVAVLELIEALVLPLGADLRVEKGALRVVPRS